MTDNTVSVSLPAGVVVDLIEDLGLVHTSEYYIQVYASGARYVFWRFKSGNPPVSNDAGHILLEGQSITIRPRHTDTGLYFWSSKAATLMVTAV